jgi:Holliday junction resolvase-like predicted endonuclease
MNDILLNEKEVENRIRDFLKSKGFRVEERNKPQGIDIVAFDDENKKYFIEVEGNKKPNGESLATNQKYTHFFRAIGQICMRMNEEGVYALVLPYDKTYLNYIDKIKVAKEKLNLKIFLIEKDLNIKII